MTRMPRTAAATRRRIALDAFGNAIPAVPSGRAASRVVEVREVIVGTAAAPPGRPGLLRRLRAWARPSPPVVLVRDDADDPPRWAGEVALRLDQAFERLHQEFDSREQHLEERLRRFEAQRQAALEPPRRARRRFILPLAAAGVLASGYVLYVLTSMQLSMTTMSGDMAAMSGHVGTMADDTRAMSRNMQNMNDSMAALNGHVGRIDQEGGTISGAAAPMGQAARSMGPFMGMFRSFMPF